MAHSEKICRNPTVKKNGCSQIWLRITIDRKIKYYPTGYEIQPKYWDDMNNVVRGSYTLSIDLQNSLDKILIEAKQAIIKLTDEKIDINFPNFENIFLNATDCTDFIALSKEYVEKNKHKFAAETYRLYNTEIAKMQEFKANISIKDINLDFYRDYERFLYTTKKNSTNTVAKGIKHVRKLENALVYHGKMKKSNSNLYKIKTVPSGREFLTYEDVLKLEEYYDTKCDVNYIKNALKCFLFACYTGLRYQNIVQLKFSDITQNAVIISDIDTVKNKEVMSIPLTSHAKKYLPVMNYDSNNGNDELIFHVPSNQKINAYLKLADTGAELHKKLHFHIARHTFATISLNIGIPLEVVQRLLGHRSIKTTQIYAKIMEKTKYTEMDKWDQLK
ncbi:MAG TPA: site-specific integrase [Bacteroidales bacterium]|nr:site-specific integrase [Bacteroidales bacterium]